MADDTKNISDAGTLPANFSAQADDDQKRHQEADQDDQSGELDPLGEDQENEPLDIDEAVKNVGINSDENGPKPLDATQDLMNDEQ
jgi:hypothetical protein